MYSGGVNEDMSSFPSLGRQESSSEKMTFELGLGGCGAQTTRTGERKKLADTGRRRDNPLINFYSTLLGTHTHKSPKNEGRDGGGICEAQKNACSSSIKEKK